MAGIKCMEKEGSQFRHQSARLMSKMQPVQDRENKRKVNQPTIINATHAP